MSPAPPWVPLLLPLAVLAGACGSTDDAAAAKSGDDPGTTWSGAARAVVAAHCTDCHVAGGAAPFPLQTWEEAAPLADVLVAAVDAGTMPPWSADPDCREVADARLMPEADKAVLREWAAAGAPAGESTPAIEPESGVIDADLTLSPVAAYTPDYSSAADDYRCQFLDHRFEAETWVTASQVMPGTNEVHHVLVFVLAGEQLTLARALEEEEGPGYPCFSGPVPTADSAGVPAGGLPGQVAAWVPGANPIVHEDGEAMRIPAGAELVMQVHYSAQGGAAQPATTTALLEIAAADEVPERLVVSRPLPVMDFVIPAGDPAARFSRRFTNWSDTTLQVRSVAPHMHLLGQREQATIVHVDGSETCLMDVPDWDFAWQQAYRMPAGETVPVAPGEAVDVACTWDNSPENQPVVDGEQAAPVDVVWGEGTADEMCLLYLGVSEPYTPSPAADAPACDAACVPDATWDELLSCSEMSSSCLSCTFDALLDCTSTTCGAALASAQDCIEGCGLDTVVLGGAPGRCLEQTCPDAYATVLECTDGVLATGVCDGILEACGLSRGAE